MSLALASRGYLCVPRMFLPNVELPTGTVTEEIPEITKAFITRDTAPSIKNVIVEGPEIRGATTTPGPTEPDPPSIVTATAITPTIRKVKKS